MTQIERKNNSMKKRKKKELLNVWDDLYELKFRAYFFGYYVNNYFINELIIDFGPMKRSTHIKFGKENKMISSDLRATAFDKVEYKKELKTLADGRIADSSYRFIKRKKRKQDDKKFLITWAKALRDETISIIAPFVEKHKTEIGLTGHPFFDFNSIKKKKKTKKEKSDKRKGED